MMKKNAAYICVIVAAVCVIACFSVIIHKKNSVPEDFSFSLVWGCYGFSSYDSKSGKLVKTTDATHPEDYVTYYSLSREEIREVYKLIAEMNPETYPDEYDPIKGRSKPSRDIILTVTYNGDTKRIRCRGISLEDGPVDEKGERFMAVHNKIVEILVNSDAWKALPEYEHFYA